MAPPSVRLPVLIELAKLRLSSLVLVTTAIGYLMAGGRDLTTLLLTVLGTAFAATGANTMNQLMEIGADRLMSRTRGRPLPEGRISVAAATAFAVLCAIFGVVLLSLVNPVAAALGAASVVLYAAVYTPLKRRTSWCTAVGAVPGALPPVIGTAAATGTVETAGWILFAILFLWQLPHFFAIAWLYRDDYRRGGFPMLSVVDPSGRRVARQSVVYAVLLAAATMTPTLLGRAGPIYAVTALSLSAAFLSVVIRFASSPTDAAARRVFLCSIAWLPIVLLALATSWIH